MRSILVLLILVMIGLNGKGQSVTALPDSVLSQCCLEVTLLNGNVTTVDWVFIQYITRDGTGTKLFVEYAPNFGGIQWETQIRIQDDFDEILERSKFIMLPFTVGSTDYAINRNWIANIEENTTTGGTWIYGRFGTPTKRKFSAVEDYQTLKRLLLACRPRAIVVAENGLYTEGDTVRMGGFLIENTTITTEGYNWMMKDTLSSVEFGLDYNTPETLDTTVYWGRRSGSVRQMVQLGNRYWYNTMKDTVGGLFSDLTTSWNSGDPFLRYQVFNPLNPNSGTVWFQVQKNNTFLIMSNETTNPYYTPGISITDNNIQIGVNENGSGDPGNGVLMGAFGDGTSNEYLFMVTKGVDNNTATNGQFLQLVDNTNGKVEFATIDLSGYLEIADTAAMLAPYIDGFGTTNRVPIFTGSRTIVNSNIQDNGTAVSIINSKPFQLGQWTTAGRPTGTSGYMGWNTTLTGIDWYNGTRWATGLESTFNRGTSTRIPFFDANGQVTESANFTYSSNRLRVTSGADYIDFNPSNGSGRPEIQMFNSGAANILLSADVVGSTGTLFLTGALNISSTLTVAGLQTGNPATFNVQDGSLVVASAASVRPFINFTESGVSFKANLGLTTGNPGDLFYETNPTNSNAPQTGTQRFRVNSNGRFGIGAGSTINYSLEQLSQTDAFGIARGTVAQRPTVASSTTPIRFNTDSLQLEYGESVGTWRQLATRAYARSLVAGSTWLKTELEASRDVDITGGTSTDFRLRSNTRVQFDGKFKIGSDSSFTYNPTTFSQTIYNNTTTSSIVVGGSGNFPGNVQIQDRNSSGVQILRAYYEMDKRRATFGYQWNLNDVWQLPSGGYAWTRHVKYDTVGVDNFQIVYGSDFADVPTTHVIKTNHPTATNLVQIFAQTATGTNLLNININGVGDVANFRIDRTINFPAYASGTKEAADLSKTLSDYRPALATDGTLLDLLNNVESYNTVTSTSSPQTLSSTKIDNLINQGSTQATFTLNLPGSPVDGQVCKITFNNAISSLTIDGNGNSIIGTTVTTAVAGTQRVFKFYAGIGWIRQN